jgi:hypothetical protein
MSYSPAEEWPCDGCGDLKQRGSLWSFEPPELYCAEPECPVDVQCLRELEATSGLQVAMLTGVLTFAGHSISTELADDLAEVIADVLETTYKAARVSHASIKGHMLRRATEGRRKLWEET